MRFNKVPLVKALASPAHNAPCVESSNHSQPRKKIRKIKHEDFFQVRIFIREGSFTPLVAIKFISRVDYD